MCIKPQSPKDDLESLAYVLIFLFRGYLPWSIDGESNVEFALSERTLKMKLSLPIDIICRHMPLEFARHLKYVRSLKYNDTPNYGKLRDMYQRLMKRMGYQYDGVYDWDLIGQKFNDVKQPSGDAVPASVEDKPLEQEITVAQSNSPIQDTPFVQNSPLTQNKTLKRKRGEEEDEDDDQKDNQEKATKPATSAKLYSPTSLPTKTEPQQSAVADSPRQNPRMPAQRMRKKRLSLERRSLKILLRRRSR